MLALSVFKVRQEKKRPQAYQTPKGPARGIVTLVMVFIHVSTFPNRKVKSCVGKIVEDITLAGIPCLIFKSEVYGFIG